MNTSLPQRTHALQCRLSREGELTLRINDVPLRPLRDGEVLVRVEAAALNPSDLLLMLAPADRSTLVFETHEGTAALRGRVPPAALADAKARWDKWLPAGNEGAGTVVATGASAVARALLGQRVAVIDGGLFAKHRVVDATQCVPLPAQVETARAAGALVNPLTALCMIETLRQEGHTAMVMTAAASSLGRMLNRLCRQEAVPLVNIVRRPEQADLLRLEGAEHVVVSGTDGFEEALQQALRDTGATLAFDATGGGMLAGALLDAMEAVAAEQAPAYSRYGTSAHKQVYVFGRLDATPITLSMRCGLTWSLGGWLLFPRMARLAPAAQKALRQRAVAELATTFATEFGEVRAISELLQPAAVKGFADMGTGAKVLVDPQR